VLTALTREVSPLINDCAFTHRSRTHIDVKLARQQHQVYEECLAALSCKILRLPPAPLLPDSVFVEDTCVVFDELAIIARPGSDKRRAEITAVAETMKNFRDLHFIEAPGTLDGGDVLCLGKSVFVGLSSRTNCSGIGQLRSYLQSLGYIVTPVNLTGCLHLKSAATQIGPNTILVNRSWVDPSVFGDVTEIDIDASEPFAANALLVGDSVVYPSAYPRTRQRLEERGIRTRTVDVSELAKAEGGVTCCSVLIRVG
jgi:dimethylargininase